MCVTNNRSSADTEIIEVLTATAAIRKAGEEAHDPRRNESTRGRRKSIWAR